MKILFPLPNKSKNAFFRFFFRTLRAQKMKKMPKLQNSLIEFFNNLSTYKTIICDFSARLLGNFEQSISEYWDIFAMLKSFGVWQLE